MAVRRTLPLTSYQRDIWAAESRTPNDPQFNVILHERLSGEIDLPALRAATAHVLRASDAFSLRFGERDGIPFQWFEDSSRAGDEEWVGEFDLSGEKDPETAVEQLKERSLAQPFDLRAGVPPFAAAVVREGGAVVHLHVNAHHIVADAWALNRISLRIWARYAELTGAAAPRGADGAAGSDRSGTADTGGRADGVGEETPSYADFAGADARYAGSAEQEADRAFHRAALDGVTPALFPRSPERLPLGGAERRGRHSFTVDGELVARIRKGGSSPFAFLAAAFASYFTRVHRTDEIVLGVPFLNRRTERELATVGQFANSLPLRVRVGEEASLAGLAAGIRADADALRGHERLALGDVLREAPAVPGERRLFDITLSYLRFPRPPAPDGVVHETVIAAPVHHQDALSVMVHAFEDDGPLRVDLDYAVDVFDEDLPIEAVAAHLGRLLRAAVEEPGRPAPTLPVLGAEERERLTERDQGAVVPYRDDMTLHGLFEEQAARTPERIAVVDAADPGGALTFAGLDARAERVARALRARGIAAGDRVAVLLERGPHTLPALLGVLKSGAAYVPVDPGYPADRIAFLLSDSRAGAVLTGPGSPEPRTPAGVPVLRVDEIPDAVPAAVPAGLPDALPVPAGAGAGPRDVAYVIYTSGSTGTPKGVMVEHHSVVNRLAWMQSRYPIGADDVLLQKTPVSFDVSVWELFWWAVEGASLALLAPGGERDPRTLLATIAARGVTTAHFVPSMLGPFLDLLEDHPVLRADAASLRQVFCSGEALSPARVEQFHRVFAGDGPRLVNLYGPTEATVDVSYHDCAPVPGEPVRRVPIGRPVDNTRLYVLDAHGEPQPVGLPGELCIGGVQVARGYFERPELTAEKFTDDPFVPGGRMYRTGDLARRLADGSLEYLGRIDGQVKIRGNRVELGEVAGALAAVPGVRDALAVDWHSATRGTHLAAYYVADDELDPLQLRAELARTLPEFMLPAYFVRIAAVPLTPNGKADRRALPEPAAPDTPATAYTAPRTAVEEALAQVWAEVLDVPRVGVHDDYFALGGDSILMLRVLVRAQKRGLTFDLSDLMRRPTVAALAAVTGSDAASGESVPDLAPFALVAGVDRARLEGRADAYPVSRLQLGLLYHSRAERDSAVYRDVFQYSLVLDWDAELFTGAFDRLVARHPVLRSSFDLGGFSEPLQIVDTTVERALNVADLRGLPLDDARSEITAHIEERRFWPYEFERPPLYHLRVHVLPGTVELVLSFHHALLDGGSVANLVRELLQDYAHTLGQDIGPVPELDLPSAAHHIVAERRALESPQTRDYWRRTLAGSELLQLDAFRPHTAPGGEELITRRVDLPAGLVSAVREFSRAHTLPVKSVLFTAHLLTLRLFSGSDDVTTGLVTHGRPAREDAERIAGLFLNTMPVRLDTAGDSWLAVVRDAFRAEQDSHPHRRYPLSAIQEDLGTTVLDTAFNYIHFRQLAAVFGLPGVRSLDFRTWEETNFSLLVNAVTEPADDRIWLRMDYQGRLFTPEQADLYTRRFTDILRRVVEHPSERADFAFLTEATAPLPARPAAAHAPDVVRAFEAQAARTPEATALVFRDRRLSYAELDARADRVARRLLALGAAPGDRIGIAMDRSPETVAVILGVLKAGGATVPLDTGYPRERIASMLEQARPFRVVAHRAYAEQLGDTSPVLAAEELFPETAEAGGADGTGGTGGPAEGPGADRTAAAGPGDALPVIDPDSIAYLLFTSGSTGLPKGVEMPHRSLANLVAWQNSIPSGVMGGTTVQYAPMSFDVSFQEIFSTLCGGGTLLLVSEGERRDMPGLLRLLDREGAERLYLPYVALQQFAETALALDTVPRTLRALLSSGEQLRVTDEIRALCQALPGVILENQYGPTESHVVTSHTMTGDPLRFPALPPIGLPVDGAEVLVLDARMRPVPPGVKGEIHLGGICLARGYAGQPELTAERFVPRPGGAPDERLYRTGDLGLVLPDGSVVCLGRSDAQVKVRGFRVEPAEVELAITRFAADHPGLTGAAVVARRREGNDSFLAAFLTGDPQRADLEQLMKQLRSALPDYMVPSHVQWLPELPLTPSGKRDDKALREMRLTASVSADATAPRDAYERVLADMLGELLQLPEVSVHDNIFDLGGTSLTAMRLVVRIEQRFGIGVPLSEFISAPTVAELAGRLRAGGAVAAFDPLVPIRVEGDRPPLFFVHPMGGNVLCYVRFAKYLPQDRPFYAFQAAGVDPGSDPLRSVEEIAASYVTRMREVQPSGPYLIGGWSFGGFVAFEIARQLRAAGEEVGRLILLDTTALNPGRRLRTHDDALLGWFFWELLWLRRGGDSPLELIPSHLRALDEKFDFIARLAADEGVLPAGSTGVLVRRLFDVYEANWRGAFAYRPEVVDQDMVLIHASEPLPEVLDSMHTAIDSMHRDPANGWRERTSGELTVLDVPGDHLTIMEEPHIEHVVRVVTELIGK
ncbi:non-ribosomal peptide synthetase [Streptomyces sp. NBC_01408]|uniref:amino acid adenylation domain-containing protein n=1 Tax=Streptomyces sp. NBC_01408 TaxID=2903855 RepID=UPI00225AC638|nr:non-ribosomal peptide synthetase [Streptomyces sp. NBC_01408]MCX4695322.1 amino acid adenylation domain-containing protein [Streptomyces sp. NBC_01408]